MPINNSIPFPIHSRVVAYLRDSGGEDQELSVPQQKEYITHWCDENNLILSAIYADVARPGGSVIGRTQFMAMMEYFNSPDCEDQGLVVWKYSRFSRDIDDSQFYRSALRIKGYIIYSIQDNVPDDDFGRLYESVIDFSNSKFRKDLGDDVKRGIHFLVTNYGAVPGTPPRGFMKQSVDIGTRRDHTAHTASRWVPDPALWEKCRHAWLMRASGYTIKQIHDEVHIFTARSSYNAFFKNRLYLGELIYSDLVIKDYVEPLITEDVWDAVQKLNRVNELENNPMKNLPGQRHPRRSSSHYLLSGLVYCARCGSLMNGKNVSFNGKPKMTYYQCSGAQRGMECDAKKVPQSSIEDIITSSMHDYILDPVSIAERDREQTLANAGELSSIMDERKRLTQKYNDNKIRIENLVDKITGDPEAPKSLIAKLKELELESEKISVQIDRLKTLQELTPSSSLTIEEAEKIAEHLKGLMLSDDLETKRLIIKSLIQRVTVERIDNRVTGIVTYWNPQQPKKKQIDRLNCLPMASASVEALPHRKTFTLRFNVEIKRKPYTKSR